MKHSTDTIIMVKPCSFGFNAETAVNNHYQKNDNSLKTNEIQEKALNEFNNFVQVLRNEGIKVNIIEDTTDPYTPDSIFPNNWFTTHEDSTVVLYPMYAKNRRLERTEKIYDFIFDNYKLIDLTNYEEKKYFFRRNWLYDFR